MIDERRIEEAKEEIYEDKFLNNGTDVVFDNDDKEEMYYKEDIKEAIGLGAKWAINELLKDLWHPASEVPRNDYTDILVVCKEPQRPIVLFPEDILDGTPDDIASYNDMWMHLCDVYRITKYCYIGDLLPKEGGEQ